MLFEQQKIENPCNEKEKKDQSRFHALLAPHRVSYDPSTLWKKDENG